MLDEEVTAAGKFRAKVRVTPTVKGIFAFAADEGLEEAGAFVTGVEDGVVMLFDSAGVLAFILRVELRSGRFGGSCGI